MATKLYVGNLAYGVSNTDLENMFTPHGTVQSAQVIMDRDTGRSKGFGFVEMGSGNEATAAINALNGKESGGRALPSTKLDHRRSWRQPKRWQQALLNTIDIGNFLSKPYSLGRAFVFLRNASSFPPKDAHASEKNASAEGEGVTSLARYTTGQATTQRPGVSVFEHEWQVATIWQVRHHLYPGLREGAKTD